MFISKINRFFCCVLVFVGVVSSAKAQDTITVQTFDWSNPSRSQVFEFPDDSTLSFSKIIMEYNMRCHGAQVGSGNVGCREWDYSCNTFITDSSRTDSVSRLHPSHLISAFSGSTFEFSNEPVYTYTRHDRIKSRPDTVISTSAHKVLDDIVNVEILDENQASYQFVMSADELTASGMTAGAIVAMEMPFELGDFMSMSFRVKMRHTSNNGIQPNEPIKGDWEEVYFDELEINAPGMSQLYFHTPFVWDGSSNLAIEFIFNDKMTPTDEHILGEEASGLAVMTNDEDHVFALDGAQYFSPDTRHMRGIDNEITIMSWIFGNPQNLPANTYFLEGVDENDNRQVNVHLPWSNGEVYWDCGNDGSGYDRINKPANEADYEGQWNHWAFTKNAVSGEMKIYLNGDLWHAGNGMHKAIDLERFNIGKGVNSDGAWSGWVNEFSLWKKELSQGEIRQAMNFAIDAGHPAFDDLLLHFDFEEERGLKVTNKKNNQDYPVVGSPSWRKLRAEELYFNYKAVESRPSITLIQGEITITKTSNPYTDSMIASPKWVRPFDVDGTDLVELNSMYLWEAGYSPVYDDMMQMVDSVYFPPQGEIEITDLQYYSKHPAKFEILSLVTPYGNGLDLGPEGKTFTFDLTDFTPILKGKKRLSLELGGQNQEEMDIKFHFIKGTPPREVVDIQNIWRFQRGNYGAIQNDEVFEPRTLTLTAEAEQYKIRSSITGHGQNGEFQPRAHYLNVNGGAQDFVFDVWKECSTIPVYPQGGTWIFDRAGWCPGDPTLLFEHDITPLVTPGGTLEIDYGVNGAFMDQANYLVSHQIVSYGPLNKMVDAAVEHIVRPSRKVEWQRENPSCNEPTIILKNYGSEILTSAIIEYGVEGAELESFQWSGDLGFGEEEMVVLPIMEDDFWKATQGDEGIFVARIISANGQSDDDESNNVMKSAYDLPQLLPQPLQLEFATNTRGAESSYKIKSQSGETLYEGSNFASNSKYVIDLDLSPGCYTLEFNDSGDDGLYYWYWEQTGQNRGRGYVKFNRVISGRGVGVKGFEAEFGRFIHYDFGVESITGNEEARILRQLSISPNPSDGQFKLDFYSELSRELDVHITDAYGRTVYVRSFEVGAGQKLNEWLDLTGQQEGMYFVKLTQADRTTTRTLILSH